MHHHRLRLVRFPDLLRLSPLVGSAAVVNLKAPWLLQELRPNVSSRYSILSVVTPSIPSLVAYFPRLEGGLSRHTRYWHVHIIMGSGSWLFGGRRRRDHARVSRSSVGTCYPIPVATVTL